VDAALAWIGQIAEWVGKFFPRRIVMPVNMGGVKYVGGDTVVVMGPGIHWYWPWSTSIDTYPTATQTDNLPSQTMETADDVSITVGGMVTYSVHDVAALLSQTHSGFKRIQAMTLAGIHRVCCRMTWSELKNEQRRGTLDTKLRHGVQKDLAAYGVTIEDCQLTDLARTRVYRLIQSTQQDNA
jgi:regulator of protease activity HflC (stomatin/prohibitin superfamily)